MAITQKALTRLFIRSMKRIARELNKPESEITKAQFVNNDAEEISDWDMRKAGGFNNLKKLHFPDETPIEVKYGTRIVNNHRKKLDKEYGQALFYEKELLNAVKSSLATQPLILHSPVKASKSSTKTKRSIVACLSDTHFGANISKNEMYGLNEFNWTIASRRLAFFVDQIANYKIAHRADTDLVFQINGDIIAGVIHNQEWFVDLLTTQFSGTVNILGQAISYLAQHFGKVRVVCTTGNHGRNIGKADKGRATTHKWDSYEHMIYVSLREILRGHPNVEFIIPEAPFAIYKVQGHIFAQTHGDTVLNMGNPGKALNMDSINNQINKLNSSELFKQGETVEVVCAGHVHVATCQLMDNGCFAMINGCLSGTDPFAQSIGIFSNNPSQTIFETTEKHAVGDIRYVQVKVADKQERLDKIIKPFVGKF